MDKIRITPEEFEHCVSKRLERCKELLMIKGKEYERNGDTLHNFRRASEIRRHTKIEALQGMMDKHLVSWLDLVDDLKDPEKAKNITVAYVDEKLGDLITYLLKAEVVVYDRLMEVKEKK